MTARKFMAILNTFSNPDIAGILTACGFAIREGISLFSALEKLGFDIEIEGVPDITDEQELSYVGISCVTQILKRHPNNSIDVNTNQPHHTSNPQTE